jgi:hypothetical protein
MVAKKKGGKSGGDTKAAVTATFPSIPSDNGNKHRKRKLRLTKEQQKRFLKGHHKPPDEQTLTSSCCNSWCSRSSSRHKPNYKPTYE